MYIGISAGAICAGESISTALWKQWDKPISEIDHKNPNQLQGMRLVKGVSFFPHFKDQWADLTRKESAELGHSCIKLKEQTVVDNEFSEDYGDSVEYWTSFDSIRA
jgi:peptidase E